MYTLLLAASSCIRYVKQKRSTKKRYVKQKRYSLHPELSDAAIFLQKKIPVLFSTKPEVPIFLFPNLPLTKSPPAPPAAAPSHRALAYAG
jgi:hypothetical protein